MRAVAALLLCLLVSFGVLHKALIIGYFVHNRSYIAVTLCENKAEPEKSATANVTCAKMPM